jgi:hypothetical protein
VAGLTIGGIVADNGVTFGRAAASLPGESGRAVRRFLDGQVFKVQYLVVIDALNLVR